MRVGPNGPPPAGMTGVDAATVADGVVIAGMTGVTIAAKAAHEVGVPEKRLRRQPSATSPPPLTNR